jgi:LPS-assembly lipoprotein
VVEGRYGFELRERLIERYNAPDGGARYNLVFDLDIEETELVVNDEAEITRYNLTGTSTYLVEDRTSGQVVFSDEVKTVTAYSATSATFPTTVAERDANIRLARALADLMVTRMAITAKDWAG